MARDPNKSSGRESLGWLATVINLGTNVAPAQTVIAVGALAILSVAVFLVQQQAPLLSVIALGAVVLILGVLAALVSRWVVSVGAKRSLLPQAIAWAFAALFTIVCGLIVSSVFFSEPEAGALFIARQLNAPELLRLRDSPPVVVRADTFIVL
jgi:predicted ATP-dependent Lon-type protease